MLITIITGFIAGSIAAWLMPGGGNSWIVDIILGLLGGVVGSWVLSLLDLSAGDSWWAGLVVAVIGACILIFIGRLFTKKGGK